MKTKFMGYRRENGVKPDSTTETYVAVKCFVENWRWSGVPFYLRTGKAMPHRASEVAVQFKDIPQILFNANQQAVGHGVLAQHIQRYARGYAKPFALTDGIAGKPCMLTDHFAGPCHDRTRAQHPRRSAPQELAVILAGQEAQVLAIVPAGGRQAKGFCDPADLRLAVISHREQCPG